MFVLVKSAETWHKTVDDIAYAGLPMGTQQMPGVRIDVGRYQANAVFLDTHKNCTQSAPLEGRISCDDCRKLADQAPMTRPLKL